MPQLSRPTLLALCLTLGLSPLGISRAEDAKQATDEKPATAPVVRQAANERSQDEAKGLVRQLPESGQQILKAGDETFLALWLPANTAEVEGVVILVPGDGESADWPQAIGPLRRKLPDAGWQTLSLTLPDPQSTAPIPRPKESPARASADTDASAADSASKPDVKGESQGSATPTPESTAEAGSGEPAQASPDQAPPPPTDPVEQRKAHAERVLARVQASGRAGPAAQTEDHRPARSWHGRLLGGTLPGGEGTGGNPEPAAGGAGGAARLPPGAGRYGAQAEPGDRRLLLQGQGKRCSGSQAAPAGQQAAESPQLRTNRHAGPTSRPEGTEQEQLYRRIRGWLSLHLEADEQQPAE